MNTNHPPLVVMGVSGCGKSTIGSLLGERLGVRFSDGDDFHPPANKAKMASGIPLDDDDRAPWLAEIGAALAPPADGTGSLIIACSALKRRYRDFLRGFAPGLVFIHLSGQAATISGRLSSRSHEYMPCPAACWPPSWPRSNRWPPMRPTLLRTSAMIRSRWWTESPGRWTCSPADQPR